MRELDFGIEDPSIRDLSFVALARCYHPEIAHDFSQTLYIMREEYRRFLLDTVAYKQSAVSYWIEQAWTKKTGQTFLCGHVAIAMCCKYSAGGSMTLQSAAKVVSEFIYSQGQVYRTVDTKNGTEERKVAISGDLADIKKAFREYQSVAHICAARIIMNEYGEKDSVFRSTDNSIGHFLATAAHIQYRLEKADGAARWDMWNIATLIHRYNVEQGPIDIDPELAALLTTKPK